jgi:hypothetical protein
MVGWVVILQRRGVCLYAGNLRERDPFEDEEEEDEIIVFR